ncbi:hypothetical protein [Bacillus paralicheniformis]|uniref:hypothetical protein n=1 Tax=Bacillus paralicheniformis TaxID=1648923 RepID=UPI0018D01644|nr:hypothetical protein [Bacillus paralicheniformis]
MKKCWLVIMLCLLLAGCATHKPNPRAFQNGAMQLVQAKFLENNSLEAAQTFLKTAVL